MALTADEGEILSSHLPPEIVWEEICPEEVCEDESCFDEVMKKTEISLIRRALNTAGGNKSKAARLLKLKPSTLRSKLEKYNL